MQTALPPLHQLVHHKELAVVSDVVSIVILIDSC